MIKKVLRDAAGATVQDCTAEKSGECEGAVESKEYVAMMTDSEKNRRKHRNYHQKHTYIKRNLGR